MNGAHSASVQRNGRGWTVQVEGVPGPARFDAESLAEAEQSAVRIVWGYTGAVGEVVLNIHLPEATADRLWLIAEYRRDLEDELRAVFAELTELRLSGPDIERVLAGCLHGSPIEDLDRDRPVLRAVSCGEAS